jgi:hypothetical protein
LCPRDRAKAESKEESRFPHAGKCIPIQSTRKNGMAKAIPFFG